MVCECIYARHCHDRLHFAQLCRYRCTWHESWPGPRPAEHPGRQSGWASAGTAGCSHVSDTAKQLDIEEADCIPVIIDLSMVFYASC